MSTQSAPDLKTPVPRGPLPILPQIAPNTHGRDHD